MDLKEPDLRLDVVRQGSMWDPTEKVGAVVVAPHSVPVNLEHPLLLAEILRIHHGVRRHGMDYSSYAINCSRPGAGTVDSCVSEFSRE